MSFSPPFLIPLYQVQLLSIFCPQTFSGYAVLLGVQNQAKQK
jgi:hypothetical protein